MDKHYIFNIGYLTHTPFPEIALGLLFLVATVILIYKFVSMVKTGKSSPKEISSAQDKNTAVEKEAAIWIGLWPHLLCVVIHSIPHSC